MITLLRWLLLKWQVVEDEDESKKNQRTLIIGDVDEYERANHLLKEAGLQHRILGRVAVNENKNDSVGSFNQLNTLVESIGIKELIFCEGTLTYKTIIHKIQQLPSNISTRFFADKSNSIVGSDSKDTSGESLTKEGYYNLSDPYQRRMKRIADLCFSLFIIITFPLQVIFYSSAIFKNALSVVVGKKTWVGYAVADPKLPHISAAVLSTSGKPYNLSSIPDIEGVKKIDFWYAKNYDWKRDIKIIIKNYKYLGKG
jgi:hypothetical protein